MHFCRGGWALLGFITAFPGILQIFSLPWRSGNGYLFSRAMKISGVSGGQFDEDYSRDVRIEAAAQEIIHPCSPSAGTAASQALLPCGQLRVDVAGEGVGPFTSCSLSAR